MLPFFAAIGLFVIVEGSIPNERIKSEGYWAAGRGNDAAVPL